MRNCFVNFCCYEYITVPMLLQAVQKRRLAQGCCWSYANSLNSLFHSYTCEKTYLAVCYLLIGDTSQFSVFCWQIKMRNLLHVGLILIISRVFTILCLLCLRMNREYCGNFQNKTVISKQFISQMSAQVKWREGLFDVDKKHRFIL